MGQLAVKFKLWWEKLEASQEKSKDEKLFKMDVAITGEETSEKISETSGEEIGPKPSTLEEGVRESEPLAEKLKIIENVIDNQRRFVEDHEVKIDSLENIVAKISRQLEEREEALQTVGSQSDKTIGNVLISTPQETQEGRRAPWEMLQEQSRVLEQHEQKLEKQVTKIEIIREMLDNQEGVRHRKQGMTEKLKEHSDQLKKQTQKYEELKADVQSQLDLQQNLLDNLFGGFIVGFIIVVLICMLPKSFLAAG